MTRAHGLTRYKKGPDEHGTEGKGCRCGRCLAANRAYNQRRDRLIAYGRWEALTDPAGTRRRLQALMYNGWSLGLLAGRLGCTRQALGAKLTRPAVSVATAEKVRVLCRELWLQPPPEGTRFEKRAATMARRYARDRGWVPLAAWDEIDDPAEVPSPSWDAEPAAPPKRITASPLVAAAIRQSRQRAELSQRALAAAVGVTESYIQLIEYGKRTPSVKTWEQLELTLGPLGIVRDQAPEAEEEAAA